MVGMLGVGRRSVANTMSYVHIPGESFRSAGNTSGSKVVTSVTRYSSPSLSLEISRKHRLAFFFGGRRAYYPLLLLEQ